MAWTSPRTWVAGEVISKALLDTHLRDNLLELNGGDSSTVSWKTWTPTISAGPSFSTISARYKQHGKMTFAEYKGNWQNNTLLGTFSMSLPATAADINNGPIGVAHVFRGSHYFGDVVLAGTTSLRVLWQQNQYVTISSPGTFTGGDTLRLVLTYEAA